MENPGSRNEQERQKAARQKERRCIAIRTMRGREPKLRCSAPRRVGSVAATLGICGIAVIGAQLSPSAASAQVIIPDVPDEVYDLPEPRSGEIPRGQAVTERHRPELAPLGLRLGGFVLAPRLGVEERFDDNIFATENNKESDFITEISPQIAISSDWSRHELAFLGGADIGRYLDEDDENYEDYRFGTGGRLDIRRRTSIGASVSYQHLHQSRTSPEDVGGLEPTERDIFSGVVQGYHGFGRFRLLAEGLFQRQDYDDVPAELNGVRDEINNDDRDRNEWVGQTQLGYTISPDYEVFVRGSMNWREYDVDITDDGVDRDSKGYEVAGGVAVDFTGITRGEFYLGYLNQDYDDPTFDKSTGLGYGAEVVWNVTRLTTITGTAERVIEETITRGASSYLSNQFGLAVDHELLRNLLLGASAQYIMNEYEGADRDDDWYSASIGALYRLHRHLYVEGEFAHRRRDSEGERASEEFAENIVLLRLTAQY